MTIYDIAKEAGVSASTVSRVVNNRPGIHAETRRRVQALLDKYNYTPDEAARGLVTQASRIIGILIEDIRVEHHTESVYVIEQALRKLGYTCITMSTGISELRKAECIRLLEQRRVEGAILMGSMFGTEAVRRSIQEHLSSIPVVIANGYLDLPNVYGILVDEAKGIEDSTVWLMERGKKHPVIALDADTPSNRNKLKGFLSALNCDGNDSGKVYRAYQEGEEDTTLLMTLKRGKDITREILQEHPETDAILYATDMLAVGGLEALKEMGKKIPEEVAVIGVDNTLYGQICSPQLTTLDNKLAEVSENASRLLLDALEKKEVAHKIVLSAEIIERASS